MAPVFAQDGEADVGVAVLIGGVGIDELLDHIKVVVQGLDLRIAGPGQNLLLDEESGAADAVGDLGAIGQAVVGDDVQHVIAVRVLLDQAGLLGLDVRPQAGGLLGRDIVQQVDQSAALDDQVRAVAAGEQIRVVLVGNLQTQGLVQVAGEELELKGNAELFLDQFVDLVVFCGQITGIAGEHGQGNGFFPFSHYRGYQRQHHCQCQQSSQDFLHGFLLRFVISGTPVPFEHIMTKLYVLSQWIIRSFLLIYCLLCDRSLPSKNTNVCTGNSFFAFPVFKELRAFPRVIKFLFLNSCATISEMIPENHLTARNDHLFAQSL